MGASCEEPEVRVRNAWVSHGQGYNFHCMKQLA